MSKDSSSSGKLLGTIKFVFDVTKSRNLNATQAYDVSTSQIVLASYPATSTIKTSAKSLASSSKGGNNFILGSAVVTGTNWAGSSMVEAGVSMFGGLRTGKEEASTIPPFKGIEMSFGPSLKGGQAGLKNSSGVFVKPENVIVFSGLYSQQDTFTKSNATKDIFSGNITVGTGLYKTWQNKYAVLKVDLLTNKAILRVYND